MKLKSFFAMIGKMLLLLMLFFGLMYLASIKQTDGVIVNKYATSDVVYANGQTARFEDKNFGRLDLNDVATLHLRLPKEPLYRDATLVFYTYNVVTKVWFRGELLTSYGEDIAAKGMMIGNRYFNVVVPDDAWGDELTITVRATAVNAISNFTNLRVYPTASAYQYFLDADLLGFLCAIVLFVLSILGLFACALDRVRGAALYNALCLISAMFLISLWLIANEGIYAFFGYSDYFWQPLEYFAGYSIAFPLLLFYRGMTNQSSRWRTVFSATAAIVAAFVTVATVLNFTNILHYDALMELAGVLLIENGVLLLLYAISIKADGNRAIRLMKIGMFVLLPTCLYELCIRVLFKLAPLATLCRYQPSLALGILFFIARQICAFFSDLYEKQKDLLSVQIRAENLRKVIDDIPAGVCRVMPRENMAIVAANDIFYDIIGYRKEEASAEAHRNVFAHMGDKNKAYLQKKIGEISAGESKTGKFEVSTEDAQGNPRSILVRYSCDLEGDHAITASIIDISDRKRMEEELRLSEERYRLALQQSGKVFFFFDVPTRTLRLSEELAQAFGLPLVVDNMPDNFLSQGLVEPESVENYRHFYERILAGEETGDTVISCHMRQAPQDVLWYKIAFTTIFDASHAPASTIITYEDINAQIAMEKNMDELQKELDNSRIKVMINQMQPHFLYNALSAIQTIVKSDPDYAYQLIYDFTVHLRSNIRALSSDAPISFQDELKNIRAYLNIEQMRFGDSLKVRYEIDCDDFKVIPLSIQPLAENAVRHGIYPKAGEGGTVTVRSYEAVSAYIVEVEDDGVGFNVNATLEKKSDSVGLKNLIFRLKSLTKASVVIDSKPGKGTKATVTIPKEGLDV